VSDAESDKAGGIFKSSNKFGSSGFGSSGKSAPKIDTEEVLAAAHKIFE
jgi:hypothetical protein